MAGTGSGGTDRASESRSRVHTVCRRRSGDKVRIGCRETEKDHECAVGDNGIGMDPNRGKGKRSSVTFTLTGQELMLRT